MHLHLCELCHQASRFLAIFSKNISTLCKTQSYRHQHLGSFSVFFFFFCFLLRFIFAEPGAVVSAAVVVYLLALQQCECNTKLLLLLLLMFVFVCFLKRSGVGYILLSNAIKLWLSRSLSLSHSRSQLLLIEDVVIVVSIMLQPHLLEAKFQIHFCQA